MTSMTRMLQRGMVVFAALALLAAGCGDDTTADGEAAGDTAPSAPVEETVPSTTIEESVSSAPVEETGPSNTIEDELPIEMSAEDRFGYGCLPLDTPSPIPGTVRAVAGGSYMYDMLLLAIAVEEAPDPILLFGGDRLEWWLALDQASAEYSGFPEMDEEGKESVGLGNPDLPAAAMQASMARCLASMEN